MKHGKSSKYLSVLSQINLTDAHIRQTFDYYRKCFLVNDWAQTYVQASASIPETLKCHSYVCLCDRTLGIHIPSRTSLEGGAIRGSLQQSNLLLSTGSELFRGCVVFPEIDDLGNIVSAVGYRFAKRIRKGQRAVIYWQRPENESYIGLGMKSIQEVIYEKACF